jgi:tetratricopeptide (TPR) repeat protein
VHRKKYREELLFKSNECLLNGNIEEAARLLETALQSAKEDCDTEDEYIILFQQSKLHYSQKEYDKALQLLESSLELQKKSDDASLRALTLAHLGLLHYKLEDTEKADQYFKESKDMIPQISDPHVLFDIFSIIAETYFNREMFTESLENAKHAKTLASTLEMAENLPKAAYLCGMNNNKLGNLEEAIKDLKESYEASIQIGDEFHKVESMYELAEIYFKKGDSKTAEEGFMETFRTMIEYGLYEDAVDLLMDLIMRNNENFDPPMLKDEKLMKKLIHFSTDAEVKAMLHSVYGGALFKAGNYNESKSQLEQAVKLAGNLDDFETREIKTTLATIYIMRRNYKKAVLYAEQALDELKGQDDEYAEAIIRAVLIQAYAAAMNLREASVHLDRAIELGKKYNLSGVDDLEKVQRIVRENKFLQIDESDDIQPPA